MTLSTQTREFKAEVNVDRCGHWVLKVRIKIAEWRSKRLRELIKSSGADTHVAGFIFLNILKRQPDRCGQLFLRKSSGFARQTKSAAYSGVDNTGVHFGAYSTGRRFHQAKPQ